MPQRLNNILVKNTPKGFAWVPKDKTSNVTAKPINYYSVNVAPPKRINYYSVNIAPKPVNYYSVPVASNNKSTRPAFPHISVEMADFLFAELNSLLGKLAELSDFQFRTIPFHINELAVIISGLSPLERKAYGERLLNLFRSEEMCNFARKVVHTNSTPPSTDKLKTLYLEIRAFDSSIKSVCDIQGMHWLIYPSQINHAN